MTWAEFKAAVKVLLTVDAQRLNTADFIEQHTRAACIDIMQVVEFYGGGHRLLLSGSDFTEEGATSQAEKPSDAKIRKAHIIRVTDAAAWDATEEVTEGGVRIFEGKLYRARKDVFASLNGFDNVRPITANDFATAAVGPSDLGDILPGAGRTLVFTGFGSDGIYTGGPTRATDYDSIAEMAAAPYVFITTPEAGRSQWWKMILDGPTLADAFAEESTLALIQADAPWEEINTVALLEEVTAAAVVTVNWHECVNPAWASRYQAIHNQIEVPDNSGRVFIDPKGVDLLFYPKLNEDETLFECVLLEYDTDLPPDDDDAEVPYDEPMVLAVSDWCKGELARHVKKDMGEYASYLQKPGQSSRSGGSYYSRRTQLHLRQKSKGRVDLED